MPKLIIGLVGRQGSGKGTAAKILEERYGAEIFRFSAILNDTLKRLALEQSRDNLIKLSESLRHTYGDAVLAYAIERDAATSNADVVVVDGIRRIGDVTALKPLPHFKLVEISAPAEVRFERMKGRGEKTGEWNMTWREFTEQEQAPTEITIPAVAAHAWKAIENSGTKDDLIDKLDEMMAELGISKHIL